MILISGFISINWCWSDREYTYRQDYAANLYSRVI